MEPDYKLTDQLTKFSKKNGIDIIGFANPKLYERFPKLNRPNRYLKDVKTVIIIGIYLYDIILDIWSQDQNSGKSFHYMDVILESHCHLVKDFLIEKGFQSVIIPYSPGLFLKDSAALAGMGPIGKNNLLITKQFGSQVRLRALVTNVLLKHGTPIYESNYCSECNICITTCPADALSNGKYNKEACLEYNLTNLKKLSDYSSIWCNICIESCPMVKKSKKSKLKGYFSENQV